MDEDAEEEGPSQPSFMPSLNSPTIESPLASGYFPPDDTLQLGQGWQLVMIEDLQKTLWRER